MRHIYDYVVVGSGSGGAAVASRLSEDPSVDVLLIEAGGSDLRLEVRAPAAFANQFHTKLDWDYSTLPEPHAGNRRIYEPRGKVLGGSSSMNAMLWMRGSSADYDGWQLPGWSWEDVRPFFLAMEDHFLDDDEHGRGGPMKVRRQSDHDPIAERFVSAAAKNGPPISEDISGPDMFGTSISPVSVDRGRRWSAARGYLDPARKRKNLTVLTRALACRVELRNGRAVGVEYEKRGKRAMVGARREVILAAGAFGTPHLLQLSGIGDAEHLASIGVDCVVDNAHVGAHLAEHPLTLINWELKPGYVGMFDAKNPKYLLEWATKRSGKLASNLVEALAHVKTQPDLRDPDFQLVFGSLFYWDNGALEHDKPCAAIGQSYWAPASRGWVRAASSDPRRLPDVQLNMFAEQADVDAMIRAIRLSRDIAATEPLADVLGIEVTPGAAVQTDAQIEEWVRTTAIHTYHPSCTARMGAEGEGVLDEQLRVRGIAGLRVADASALPHITHANTNAPSILMGERCADFIRTGG